MVANINFRAPFLAALLFTFEGEICVPARLRLQDSAAAFHSNSLITTTLIESSHYDFAARRDVTRASNLSNESSSFVLADGLPPARPTPISSRSQKRKLARWSKDLLRIGVPICDASSLFRRG
jgi:hypothetical protein